MGPASVTVRRNQNTSRLFEWHHRHIPTSRAPGVSAPHRRPQQQLKLFRQTVISTPGPVVPRAQPPRAREGEHRKVCPPFQLALSRAETQEASAPDPARSCQSPKWTPCALRSQPTTLNLVSPLNFLSTTLPRCCGIEDPTRGKFPTSGDILRPRKPHCHLASLPPTAFSHQPATSSSHRPPGTAAIAPWVPHGRRSSWTRGPSASASASAIGQLLRCQLLRRPHWDRRSDSEVGPHGHDRAHDIHDASSSKRAAARML